MKNHLASAATLCLVVLCLFAHHSASANPINSVESGTLLLKAPGQSDLHLQPAQILSTRADIEVSGLLTRTRLSQSFSNNSTNWLEAVYVFPLPDSASVDSLTMTIGDRTIKGIIQTRSQARKTYEDARSSGKKASLLEQQRANLFTSRVANIPPGQQIDITISFQSRVRYLDGSFSLNFPLTITPRYIPGQRLQTRGDNTTEQSFNTTTNGWAQLADADEITPPMVPSAHAAETKININIDAGLPVESISSGSHSITTEQHGDIWQVSLTDTTIKMDRDFTLTWHPATGQSPHAAVFRESRTVSDKTESFASIMMVPPQGLFDDQQSAREVIFVIDTSGSMQGNSIKQARTALRLGIDRLSDQDTFNVIEFDNNTRALFSTAMAATRDNRRHAIDWVSALYADGGTEIKAAMQAALANQNSHTDRLRQIIFVTDGSVGNEDEIFRMIGKNLNGSRLFTVGIGSAPNTWFMRKAAELGRGSYVSIARDNEVHTKMLGLFNKLERPVLTNITLHWQGVVNPEVYPATIPDLYAGEPVLADARWNNRIDTGELLISGQHAGQQWQQRLSLATPAASDENHNAENHTADLHKRWAKRKIESLEDSLLFGGDYQSVEDAITATALNYSLVSKYTSLVAVEQLIARVPEASPLATSAVPSAMPAGNTMALPQGSIGIGIRLVLSAMFSLLAILFGLATLHTVRIHE